MGKGLRRAGQYVTYAAVGAAAGAMSLHVDPHSVVHSQQAPVPVNSGITQTTVPVNPAPQQPQEQRTEQRVTVPGELGIRDQFKAVDTPINGGRADTRHDLMVRVLGEAQDGHGQVYTTRKQAHDHAGARTVERSPEAARESKFIRINNVRISTDPDIGESLKTDSIFLTREDGSRLKEYDRDDLLEYQEAGIELRELTHTIVSAPKENKKRVAKLKREGRYQTPKPKKRTTKQYFLYVDPKYVSAYVRDLMANINRLKAEISESESKLKTTTEPSKQEVAEWAIARNMEALSLIQTERDAIHYYPKDDPNYLFGLSEDIVRLEAQILKEVAKLSRTSNPSARIKLEAQIAELTTELDSHRSELESLTYEVPSGADTDDHIVFDHNLLKNMQIILSALKKQQSGRPRFKSVQQRGGSRELPDNLMTHEEAIALDAADDAKLFTSQAAAFDYDWLPGGDTDTGMIDWDELDDLAAINIESQMNSEEGNVNSRGAERLAATPNSETLEQRYSEELEGDEQVSMLDLTPKEVADSIAAAYIAFYNDLEKKWNLDVEIKAAEPEAECAE